MESNQTQQQKKVILHFSLEGRGEQSLTLLEESEGDLLLNYETIRKKALQSFRLIASGEKNIRLVICNFWGKNRQVKIPIFNPKNWTTLIFDMLQRDIYDVKIEMQQLGELRERKQRVKENAVQFDSDGSIESAEDNIIKEAIIKNTPSSQPYRGEAVVRCHFCNYTSREKKGSREAGPFYGPFQGKVYAHLLCLLWMSYVYLDEELKLRGVEKAIKETKQWRCMICKQKGSSFWCHSKNCKKLAHYRCAMLSGWYFNWSNFSVYCPEEQKQPVWINSQSISTLTLTNRQHTKRDRQLMKQSGLLNKQDEEEE